MTEIRVPTLGESVTEATIGRWFKKAGEAVAVDEPLVELETDKVTIEVPAPSAGVLGEIIAKDGETVAVGALLGQINDGAAYRSFIDVIEVGFDSNVAASLGGASLTLHNDTTNQDVVIATAPITYDPVLNIASWDLSALTLPDGAYTATLVASQVNASGRPLDGDGDGMGGDDYNFTFNVLAGDLNGDNVVNAVDIDLLSVEARGPASALGYDLTSDGLINQADRTHLVEVIIGTFFGDATLDWSVSIGDLTILAGNFNDGNAPYGWADGDFNGDGNISIGDLTLLSQFFGQSTPPPLTGDGDGESDGDGAQALLGLTPDQGTDSAASDGDDEDEEENSIIDILSELDGTLRD